MEIHPLAYEDKATLGPEFAAKIKEKRPDLW